MKKLIMILALISPLSTYAVEKCLTDTGAVVTEEQLEIKTDVPKFLEGAVIIVRTADGRESTVPAEKFKVVPRKQQFITTKTKQLEKTVCSAEQNKNRVALLGGQGPKGGFDKSATATTVTVESRVGVIGGLQYQRLVTDRISVGAQLQDNKSALLSVGLDF